MKKLIILLCSVIIVGCNVAKHQIADMQVYAIRYPNDFKTLANTLDPCFNGVAKSDTITIKGKPDTISLPGSTVISYVKGVGDTIIKTITLPGRQVILPTFVTIRDTVTDNRALEAAKSLYKAKSDSLIVVQTQLTQVKHGKNIWMWLCLGLGALVLIYCGIKVYTFFTGGAVVSTVKNII